MACGPLRLGHLAARGPWDRGNYQPSPLVVQVAGPQIVSAYSLPGFVNLLQPRRFKNKHVQLLRCTISASGLAAFTGQRLWAVPSVARVGGDYSAYSSARGTADRGPRMRAALQPQPQRRQTWIAPRWAAGWRNYPLEADHRASVEVMWRSLTVPPTPTPRSRVYIFSRNSSGQKSPLTNRLTHPYTFLWFYLPPQLSFFFARG